MEVMNFQWVLRIDIWGSRHELARYGRVTVENVDAAEALLIVDLQSGQSRAQYKRSLGVGWEASKPIGEGRLVLLRQCGGCLGLAGRRLFRRVGESD